MTFISPFGIGGTANPAFANPSQPQSKLQNKGQQITPLKSPFGGSAIQQPTPPPSASPPDMEEGQRELNVISKSVMFKPSRLRV